MEKQAKYIKRIEIDNLWGRFNIVWELQPDVNILSGINGVGKTTIINRTVKHLDELSGKTMSGVKDGVRVYFDDPEATYIPYDVIHSYDKPLFTFISMATKGSSKVCRQFIIQY
jgi:Predicted GTPases